MTRVILLLLLATGMAGTVMASPVASKEKAYLFDTEGACCVLVVGDPAKAEIPAPVLAPTLDELFGPGVHEDDLPKLAGKPGDPFPRVVPLAVGANVTINIIYNDGANEGFNDPVLGTARRAAFEYAMGLWEDRIQGPASISINAQFNNMGGTATSATLASAGPGQFWENFSGARFTNTWYPEALVEILSGSDPDGATLDINAQFNTDVDGSTVLGSNVWYYGTDSNPPAGDFDFVTVATHEVCHGLGFISFFNSSGQWASSGDPYILDRYLRNGAGQRLIDLPVSAANVTNNNVFFSGYTSAWAWQTAAGGTGNVPWFAPNPWNGGSSMSHFDETSIPDWWELQTPNYTIPHAAPDSLVVWTLGDIGYSLPNSAYVGVPTGTEKGTRPFPWNTVAEGITDANTGGNVRIQEGSYPENLTITKSVILRNWGGSVIVGSTGAKPGGPAEPEPLEEE